MPTTATHAVIRRATNSAHRAIDAMDARILGELTTLYREAAADIRERIRLSAGADNQVSLAELRNVLGQVDGILGRLDRIRNDMTDDAIREAAQLGVAPFDPLAASQLRVSTLALMRVSEDAIRFVRTFVAQDGLQLSDRIWQVSRAKEAVVRSIERAIILGSSAEDTVRDLLAQNALPGRELLRKASSATPGAIGDSVEEVMTGAAAQARRLVRTELNRAHGEAYMMAGKDHPDFAGWKFLLSPAHPAPDICDLLSEQNLYGLGNGVYPTREATPWPAHPNTLSYIEIVFRDEITDEDRAGKETPMQALERLSPERQEGILGVYKYGVFRDGNLTQGMIRAKATAVATRVGS